MKFLKIRHFSNILKLTFACLITQLYGCKDDTEPCIDCDKSREDRDTIFVVDELLTFFPDDAGSEWIYTSQSNDTTIYDTVRVLKSNKYIQSDWTLSNNAFETKTITRRHTYNGFGNVSSINEETIINSLYHGKQLVITNYWGRIMQYPLVSGYNSNTETTILLDQAITISGKVYSNVLLVATQSDSLWIKSDVGIIQKNNLKNQKWQLLKFKN